MLRSMTLLLIVIALMGCGGATAAPTETPTLEPMDQPALMPEALTTELPTAADAIIAPEISATGITDVNQEVTAVPMMAEGILSVIETDNSRELVLIGIDRTIIPVMSLSVNDVAAMCSENAMSPNGEIAAVYAGGAERGTLHLMHGTSMPQPVAQLEYLTCVLGNIAYTPDSAGLAYLEYPSGASRQEFARGTLRLIDTTSLGAVWSADNVVAFDMAEDGIAYVSFYTNSQNEADEAAINWYDNSSEREIATLIPNSEDCRFTSASVARVSSAGQTAAVIGQRCDGEPRMRWQFYVIGDDASTTLVSSDTQPGDFVAFARNNILLASPNGAVLYFTVPDGLTANTVAIAAVDRVGLNVDVIVPNQAIVPTFRGAANAEPRLSADGRWLGFTLTNPNNENTLYALDLEDRANPPITISAGARGDSLSSLAFLPDSARIAYVSGASEGGDNSLFTLNLSTGTETRVRRGNFGRHIALSPAGDQIALDEWTTATDANGRTFPYRAIRVVSFESSTEMTLFEDTTSEAAVRQTAYPLAWLGG